MEFDLVVHLPEMSGIPLVSSVTHENMGFGLRNCTMAWGISILLFVLPQLAAIHGNVPVAVVTP